MSFVVLKNMVVKVGTSNHPSNLSSYVRNMSINYRTEMLDKTAMGSSGRKRISGLRDWDASMELNQCLSTGGPDSAIWPMLGSTARWISVKTSSSQVGVTNPRFHGNFVLRSYTPLSGVVGSLALAKVDIVGDGDLVMSSTPMPYDGTSVTATLSSAGAYCDWLKLYDLFNVSIVATTDWVGSVELQRKYGSTGSPLGVIDWSTSVEDIGFEPEDPVYYRLNVDSHSAGSVTVRLSQ